MRKIPSEKERHLIISAQGGYCCYCGQKFNEMAFYKKPIILKPHIDHIVPHSWTDDNRFINQVAACVVCNKLKKDKIFATVYEIIDFVLAKWHQNGEMTQKKTDPITIVKRLLIDERHRLASGYSDGMTHQEFESMLQDMNSK